jgi:Protein of unknown function (DUF4240)
MKGVEKVNEEQFWSLIEGAWDIVGGYKDERDRLSAGQLSYGEAEVLLIALVDVAHALRSRLERLSAEDLLAFDRILERKLYDIDRSEVHEATDGSDDGFLYARGFIVAAGQAYYDAVNRDPSRALMDLWCEEMCYLSWHLYQDKYGEMEPSGITRESFSNPAGWKN